MEKTVDILMLPTNTKTNVLKVYSDVNKVLYNLRYNAEKNDDYKEYQHLYLLSNEEVKEGDFCMSFPEQLNPNNIHICIDIDCKLHKCMKIIATTDESLGLPKPSNKFLKKFCEYGGLKVCSVKLDYIHTDFAPNGFETFLKITSDNTVVTHLG